MGLKTYEQEIAAAVSHPDPEHARIVRLSLAASLRRHEWPSPDRRAAAMDLAERAQSEARRLGAASIDRVVVLDAYERDVIRYALEYAVDQLEARGCADVGAAAARRL